MENAESRENVENVAADSAHISEQARKKINEAIAHDNHVYILITQCLQNSFFLANEDRLSLPPEIVTRMLVGNTDDRSDSSANNPIQAADAALKQVVEAVKEIPGQIRGDDPKHQPIKVNTKNNRRTIDAKALKNGPLYKFLDRVFDENARDNSVHVISIRDWHQPSPGYDSERRSYGSHCEAGSWEAEPIEGYGEFLEPWKHVKDPQNIDLVNRSNKTWDLLSQSSVSSPGSAADLLPGGKIYYKGRIPKPRSEEEMMGDQPPKDDYLPGTFFHDVLSNSLFDFNPNPPLRLEVKDKKGHNPSYLEGLLDYLIPDESFATRKVEGRRVYVVVIGVYSDIKIMTLLTALRSLYDIDVLVVSDVLTGSTTLERHLTGLDYADKVLGCEIVHSLNDLAGIICQCDNPIPDQITKQLTSNSPDFSIYRSYYLNKQSVLSYGDQKLIEYVDMTRHRSTHVYRQILGANEFLLFTGKAFLAITIFLVLGKIFFPETFSHIDNPLLLLTGGLSLSAVIGSFFNQPTENIQQNLINMVRLQNYLETYSTVTALLRYHFTTPESLTKMYENPKDQVSLNQDILDVINKQVATMHAASTTFNEALTNITMGSKPSSGAADKAGKDTPPNTNS